ncbi:MAG: zinc dependent phospholipase C family protein [Romboutsia sp.]
MPGSISHYLFAKDCLSKLDNKRVKNIINDNLDIYILGAQGPNFFDYDNYLPLISDKNLSMFSNLIHCKNINDFFANMISYSNDNSCIRHIFNTNNFKNITISYIYGFLCHYTLDKLTHPYIYSLQFDLSDKYTKRHPKSLHKSIETHIDILLLKKFKSLHPWQFDEYLNINLNSDELLIICDMYKFLMEKVYGKSISYDDVSKSINLFIKSEQKLKSSNKLLALPYVSVKKVVSKNSFADSKAYLNHKYCINDLLNTKNNSWENPFSYIKSNYSFIDIYMTSIDYCLDLINCLDFYFNNEKTISEVLSKINDKSFFTNQDWRLDYKIL